MEEAPIWVDCLGLSGFVFGPALLIWTLVFKNKILEKEGTKGFYGGDSIFHSANFNGSLNLSSQSPILGRYNIRDTYYFCFLHRSYTILCFG